MCFFNTLCGKGYLGFFMVGTAINWPPKAAICLTDMKLDKIV